MGLRRTRIYKLKDIPFRKPEAQSNKPLRIHHDEFVFLWLLGDVFPSQSTNENPWMWTEWSSILKRCPDVYQEISTPWWLKTWTNILLTTLPTPSTPCSHLTNQSWVCPGLRALFFFPVHLSHSAKLCSSLRQPALYISFFHFVHLSKAITRGQECLCPCCSLFFFLALSDSSSGWGCTHWSVAQ